LPAGASAAGFSRNPRICFRFRSRTIRILVIGDVSDELGEAADLLRRLESIALFWHFFGCPDDEISDNLVIAFRLSAYSPPSAVSLHLVPLYCQRLERPQLVVVQLRPNVIQADRRRPHASAASSSLSGLAMLNHPASAVGCRHFASR